MGANMPAAQWLGELRESIQEKYVLDIHKMTVKIIKQP